LARVESDLAAEATEALRATYAAQERVVADLATELDDRAG